MLDTSISCIKGIGEVRAKMLNKLGLFTLRDLINNFPRAYDDRTEIKTIDSLQIGEKVCCRGIAASEPHLSHIRRGLDIVKVRIVDSKSSMSVTFFNQSYVKNSLHQGESYIFYGKVGGLIGRPEMINPVFERESAARNTTGRIVPIYKLTAGLSQNIMARSIKIGLNMCGDTFPDPLPKKVREEYSLAQARFAYENIHFPSSFEALDISRRRLIFEEFFILSCALQTFSEKRVKRTGIPMMAADLSEFYAALPFRLTDAQRRAVEDAVKDMGSLVPMSRLIQGDVGSGKTVVAAACCWYAFKSEYQSAFMAPTEILANQHAQTLSKLLLPLGVSVVCLTGGMSAKEKRDVKKRIKNHEVDVIVGTHALISGDVEYSKLGLAVTDEQHRFGVQQRAALAEKGQSPHMLVMSATPIPRTLALMLYGDLDVSVIDELPPGREKIDTFSVNEGMRQRIYNFIRRLVGEGRQVFIVCPTVEETDGMDDGIKAVKEYAKKLADEVFPDLRVALMHGKMRPKEKETTSSAFANGDIDILVATTVIEVGVDVPNAALIVVENANYFGLSQLHQLRGRVGRGKYKSYCVLFEGSGGEKAKERLKVMCDTNNGFKIAEEDLKLRGPGDFFGSRQSGLFETHIASFETDMELLASAQRAAKKTITDDPLLKDPENAELSKYINSLIERTGTTFN